MISPSIMLNQELLTTANLFNKSNQLKTEESPVVYSNTLRFPQPAVSPRIFETIISTQISPSNSTGGKHKRKHSTADPSSLDLLHTDVSDSRSSLPPTLKNRENQSLISLSTSGKRLVGLSSRYFYNPEDKTLGSG